MKVSVAYFYNVIGHTCIYNKIFKSCKLENISKLYFKFSFHIHKWLVFVDAL